MSGKRKEQAQKRKLQLEKVGELVEKAKAEGLTLNKLRNLLHEVHQRETSLRDDRETISNTLEELARIRIVTTIDVLLQELFKKKLDVLILDIVKGQLLSSRRPGSWKNEVSLKTLLLEKILFTLEHSRLSLDLLNLWELEHSN